MANSRPVSMIIPPGVFDEGNTNGSKLLTKKALSPAHSSNSVQLPVTNSLINDHSSSSSIDSNGAKPNLNPIENNSATRRHLIATTSSTTTDSGDESEQDNDDNDTPKSLDLPALQAQTQQHGYSMSSSKDKSTPTGREQISRRMKHFQKLFKSEITGTMPELIDSYVCAYQGDILLQGKMYITDRYLCFHSRIISYVTKHVHPWEQIIHVSKERVAFIFPTAIGIKLKTPERKIIYASFLYRDQAYEKIHSIWSRFHLDDQSLPDEDQHRSGSSKTSQNSSQKRKKNKDEHYYEPMTELEPDAVLQLCLPTEKKRLSKKNKRRTHSVSSRSGDEKQRSSSKKKLVNSVHPASPARQVQSLNDRLLTRMDSSPRKNHSEMNDSTVRTAESTLINRSSIKTRPDSLPTNSLQSDMNMINSSSNLLATQHSLIVNSNSNGYFTSYVHLLFISLISLFKLIMRYFLLLLNQFKTYPMKISLLLFIFLLILIIHSFYLIKLAYRIEHRLQSLHYMWPSSIKNSFSSSKPLS